MKIAVLLSGGVDSSVALRLLAEEGHDVTAFYLKIWLQDDFSFLGNCPWEEDLEFAEKVCAQTGVPLQVVPLQNEYWDKVVSYTIAEIQQGHTPNPDMFCNSLIKFGVFLDKIDSSYEKVASGHYARVAHEGDRVLLKSSPDAVKDQTYFLAYLNKQQLSRAAFPIGKFDKKEIRAIAAKYNLANMGRKDSQGICFLGKISFKDFIKHHLGELPGDLVDADTGKVMGKHPGYYFYTIGQRQGIGLHGGPWYVVKKDTQNNIIYISTSDTSIKQARGEFTVHNINNISFPETDHFTARVKIRHGARSTEAECFREDEAIRVKLTVPERGLAPGQFAVFYKDDVCYGGGVIDYK